MQPDHGAGLRRRRVAVVGALFAVFFAVLAPRTATGQDLPYTYEEVVQLGASRVVPEARVIALIGKRCVAFRADAAALGLLRAAGVRERVLAAVRSACRILEGEPASLRIEPDSVSVRVGDRVTLTTHGLGPGGKLLERVQVRWSSADQQVATVDEAGRVSAHAPGMTRVTVRATNDVRAVARVWVRPAPPPPAVASSPDPGTALLVGSLVPGAGQFYTAQPTKGLLVFGGVAGALSAGFAFRDGGDRPLLWPGIAAAAGLWIYGALDGHHEASEKRRKLSRGSSGPRWEVLSRPGPTASGNVNVSLLTLRF